MQPGQDQKKDGKRNTVPLALGKQEAKQAGPHEKKHPQTHCNDVIDGIILLPIAGDVQQGLKHTVYEHQYG